MTALDVSNWGDPLWRICNLYWIQDEQGRKVRFEPNDEQLHFYHNQWLLNAILKARQLGFTTFIDIMALDCCLFTPNFMAGIIAHNLEDAGKIFRKKIKFPYDNLPPGLLEMIPLKKDTGSQMVFGNDSEISVGTSMRSGTLQLLHVSEFGKICRKHPDKAEEIVTGAFNAVHGGQRIYIESTAEGRSGHFYDICKKSQDRKRMGRRLTEMDFKFHFYPWHEKRSYVMDPNGVDIPKEYREYFIKLKSEQGIVLTDQQQAWYVKKADVMGDKMKQEFPSYPEEAFEQSIIGSYYGSILSKMRTQGRVAKVPHTSSMPVNTFWDLGRNDCTAIWFHQLVAGEHRFIHYYEMNGEDLAHFYRYLEELRVSRGFIYGKHYLPHDAENKNLEHNQSRVERLEELGIDSRSIEVVQRIESINDGIEMVRKALPTCWIDIEECDKGIICLEEYQKRWNEKQGAFMDYPLHNHASNGADAFRQFAQAFDTLHVRTQSRPNRSRRGAMSA
jgi:hypothetical protein